MRAGGLIVAALFAVGCGGPRSFPSSKSPVIASARPSEPRPWRPPVLAPSQATAVAPPAASALQVIVPPAVEPPPPASDKVVPPAAPPVPRQAKPEQGDAANEVRFPRAVAGFMFGMTRADAERVCVENYQTLLESRGVISVCPFAPMPLDFAKGSVVLTFGGGRLVSVLFEATTWSDAFDRVTGKYGDPNDMSSTSRKAWVPFRAGLNRRIYDFRWAARGGNILLLAGEHDKPLVDFISDAAEASKQEGF